MTFTEIDLTSFEKSRSGKPSFRISKGGSMAINKTAMLEFIRLGVVNMETQHFMHLTVDNDGAYWMYINQDAYNGLKIRITETDKKLESIIQCRGLVNQLIADLDLAIGDGKKSSVRMDIDTDNPMKYKKNLLFRIF